MRVVTDLFVSALIRRVFSGGGFAAIEKKGAAEAGASFIRQRFRDGLETLYGPAPQSFFDQEDSGDRKFEIRAGRVEVGAIAEIIAREIRFDPDLWLVELELEDVSNFFNLAGNDKP